MFAQVFFDFVDSFWSHFGVHFSKEAIQKLIFFERLLEAAWSHLGRLLGCLGGLLGGLVFQKTSKKQYKMFILMQ